MNNIVNILNIDTSSQHCALGFLKNKALQVIVDAPRDNRIYNSFNVILSNTQSMPINESGLLEKFFIAAKFDHTVPSGWPVLQIRRIIHTNDSSYFSQVFSTTMEPRPTGYLNVFEYDVQSIAFDVQNDDLIQVFWPNSINVARRYSLTYFRNSSNVMLSIKTNQTITLSITVDDSTSTPEPLTTMGEPKIATKIPKESTTRPKEDTTTMSSTESSTKAQNQVAIIAGGVLCALVIMILLVALVIAVFVVLQCRSHTKDFSLNTNDLKTLPPVLDNPTYSLVDGKFYKSSNNILLRLLCTINHEYFVISDSLAYVKIQHAKNISNTAVQGHLSENY